VHEPSIFSDMLGQVGQKGDDVVLHFTFDLVDPGNVELDISCLPHRVSSRFWNYPKVGLSIAGMGLDLLPNAEFRLG